MSPPLLSLSKKKVLSDFDFFFYSSPSDNETKIINKNRATMYPEILGRVVQRFVLQSFI